MSIILFSKIPVKVKCFTENRCFHRFPTVYVVFYFLKCSVYRCLSVFCFLNSCLIPFLREIWATPLFHSLLSLPFPLLSFHGLDLYVSFYVFPIYSTRSLSVRFESCSLRLHLCNLLLIIYFSPT